MLLILLTCMSTKIPIKFEWEGDTINTAKNLWYTYSSIRVVEVIVLTRILDHLMRQIAISDGWINKQKYPRIENSIRILQHRPLDSNICPTYPGTAYETFEWHFSRGQRFLNFKLIEGTGPAWAKKSFLSASSFCILHSSELDFIRTFFIWNGLDFISTFSIWNGLDYQHIFHLKWAGLEKHFLYGDII